MTDPTDENDRIDWAFYQDLTPVAQTRSLLIIMYGGDVWRSLIARAAQEGIDVSKLADNDRITAELSSGTAVKVPLVTGNLDGDEPLEIYFAGTGNGELKVLDNATVDNTVRTGTGEQGSPVTVSDDTCAS